MATISPYALRGDYVSNGPVSALDLNRRARVISSQLPGALRSSGLNAGVMPLWEPAPELAAAALLVDLNTAAAAALKVTKSGSVLTMAAGAANVTLAAGVLIYTQSAAQTAAIPAGAGPFYAHLRLQIPAVNATPGAADSLMGSAPLFMVSEIETEPGALLLADVTGGVLRERRRYTAPVMLAIEMLSLRVRLDALSAPAVGASGPTTAQFNALQVALDAQSAQIAALSARIGAPGTVTLADDLDHLLHRDVARLEVAVALDVTAFAREADASLFVPGKFGNGETLSDGAVGRDVHSGNTTLNTVEGSES